MHWFTLSKGHSYHARSNVLLVAGAALGTELEFSSATRYTILPLGATVSSTVK